jgi:hypothetical protein
MDRTHRKSRIEILLFVAALAAVVLALFWEPLFSGKSLFSPDASPYYVKDSAADVAVRVLSGGWSNDMLGTRLGVRGLHPTRLLRSLLPPLVYHVASYIFDVLLIALAAFYFLRGHRARRLAAATASVALGFAGYSFTLISAGHRGVFDTLPYAILVLGLIDRAVSRRSYYHFAAAGVCTAFGLAMQPDIMLLLAMLIAAYGVFRLAMSCPRKRAELPGFTLHMVAGAVCGALFLGATAFTSFLWLSDRVVPYRDSERGETPDEKWEFATNWSLPPEDLLEFVAPCVFGYESGDRNGWYWGRLGRPLGWERIYEQLRQVKKAQPQQTQQLQQLQQACLRSLSLRQHTVYVGVLQLVFATYALAWAIWFGRRRERSASDSGTDPDGPAAAESANPSPAQAGLQTRPTGEGTWGRPDVLFWCGAFTVCLLLSLGRFAPFYRFFYAIPYMSAIRCPVKFIHLLNIATCFLCGFGLDAFFGDTESTEGEAAAGRRRLFVWAAALCGVAALLLFVGIGVAATFKSGLSAFWRDVGLAGGADTLFKCLCGGLRHGGILFLLAAGAFVAARTAPRRVVGMLPACLLVIVAIDVASVGKHYVRVKDVSALYRPNPVADTILADDHFRAVYYLGPRRRGPSVIEGQPGMERSGTWRDWQWGNFTHHRVDFTEPRIETVRMTEDYERYFAALEKSKPRLWQLTSTRYLLGQTKAFEPLIRHDAFEVVQSFSSAAERVTLTGSGGGQNVLVRYKGALPRALVYHAWETVDRDDALGKLADEKWDPIASVCVSGDCPPAREPQASVSPVEITRHTTTKVVLEADLQREGVLLLNDRHDPDWKVTVDGEPAELLVCNYIMRGVHLPAGSHRIVMTYRPYLMPFLLSLAALAAIVGWWVLTILRTRKQTAGQAE